MVSGVVLSHQLTQSGSPQWVSWSLNSSTATSSAPPSSVQVALVVVVFFVVCLFVCFFKKRTWFLSLSQDILKTPAKAITRS